MAVSRLDDEDYPAVAMGQAAELLEAQPAFLRSLDTAGVVTPQRSSGGHRRYSRRQLERAARLRDLFDQGMTLDAAARIVSLEDELDAARTRIAELQARLDAADAATDTGPRGHRQPGEADDAAGAGRRGPTDTGCEAEDAGSPEPRA